MLSSIDTNIAVPHFLLLYDQILQILLAVIFVIVQARVFRAGSRATVNAMDSRAISRMDIG